VVTAIDDETPETAETADDAEIEVPVEAVDGFEALYRTEYVPMLRVAYLLLHSTELAEEAVHDAFAKVYERWSRTTNRGGYLRTCVVNRCRDLSRRRRIERRHRLAPVDADELGARELLDALRRLPIKRRAAVVLRYYEGLTEHETAAVLGVPVGTVKSMVSRALDQLRTEVDR
jgi:RNA polymerase sigma factor (sigma-70 family)